jgi:hypothetical protein
MAIAFATLLGSGIGAAVVWVIVSAVLRKPEGRRGLLTAFHRAHPDEFHAVCMHERCPVSQLDVWEHEQ